MANLIKYYIRASHPRGFWGKQTLKSMNGKQHAALPEWVFEDLKVNENALVIDVGCGGGANVARLLKMCPQGTVTGLDRSQLALETANEYNYRDVVDKKCYIKGGNVNQMPCAKDMYDLVTAFETVYFWSSLETGLEEVLRILKPGGTCVIANEMDGNDKNHRKLEREVGMLVYTIEEITDTLVKVGFTDISSRYNEANHFICVTARKPV